MACLHSDSPEPNGQVMDVLINKADTNTTDRDGEGAPQVKGAESREGQNGNKWHDPGGGEVRSGLQRAERRPNGRSLGERGPGNDTDREQPPHRSHRSAAPGSDAGEEGQALVDSLDPSGDLSSVAVGRREELAIKRNI